MGTISVLGHGEAKFTPDTTRVIVQVSQTYVAYDHAFNAGVSNANKLKDIVAAIGFDRDIVKTSTFEINKNLERERVARDDYKWVHRGYTIKQIFTIDLEMGNPNLSTLLSRIGKEIDGVENELSFVLGDIEGARLKLIEAAVKDALTKAETMAAVLGKRLGDIKSLNYGVPTGNRDNSYETCCDDSAICIGSAPQMDFTPKDLNGCAEVEAVWELL